MNEMAPEEGLGELTAVLDRYRNAVQGLPGVVGTGVGLRSDFNEAGKPIIQVFVRSPDYVDAVRLKASAILGSSVAVIVSGDVTAADH